MCLIKNRLDDTRPTLAKKVFAKANALFDASGMTLEQLGEKMGYGPGTARKAAWGFLKNTSDPRLSTLEALAQALAVEVKDLL
jgi:transcriptional regulator with XRE-family HTH domain